MKQSSTIVKSEFTASKDNVTYIYTDYLNGHGTFTTKNINYIDTDLLEDMCKKYPALDKAWQHFLSVYNLVNEDYKRKNEEDMV